METVVFMKTVADVIAVVAQNPGGITAATIGWELWGTPTDTTAPAKYARSAGKMLRKAKADGKLREEFRGNQRLWFVR